MIRILLAPNPMAFQCKKAQDLLSHFIFRIFSMIVLMGGIQDFCDIAFFRIVQQHLL
jgi:hypothetical protein